MPQVRVRLLHANLGLITKPSRFADTLSSCHSERSEESAPSFWVEQRFSAAIITNRGEIGFSRRGKVSYWGQLESLRTHSPHRERAAIQRRVSTRKNRASAPASCKLFSTQNSFMRRLLKIFLILYLAGNILGGIALAWLALHPFSHPITPQQTERQLAACQRHSVQLQEVSIAAHDGAPPGAPGSRASFAR